MDRFLRLISGSLLALAVTLMLVAPAIVPQNAFGDGGGGVPVGCPAPTRNDCPEWDDTTDFQCEVVPICTTPTNTCFCKWDAANKKCRCPK